VHCGVCVGVVLFVVMGENGRWVGFDVLLVVLYDEEVEGRAGCAYEGSA